MSVKNKIKPTDIHSVLDLAWASAKNKKKFIPLFSGDAGLGKSQICQEWVARQKQRNPNFFFLDLRFAYLEAPDLIGLPRVCSETHRTIYSLPDFWPKDPNAEGLILIEEPNRANSSVTNAAMQMFTDHKVHEYNIPPMVIMAGCINEGNNYDTNTMDTAFRNRFVVYNVGYDHKSFIEYVKKTNWHPTMLAYVQSGQWVFKAADELGDQGHYISPRSLAMLNTAMVSGLENHDEIFYSTAVAILGDAVGRDFYKFVKNVRPLTAHDFVEDSKDAFKRLEKFCDKDNYKGDIVAILIDSLVENWGKMTEINLDLVCKVMHIIPKDQVYQLGQGIVQKSDLKLEDFIKHDPKLKEAIKNSLRG